MGDDGPSANYVAMKHRDCAELGIASRGEHLPATATLADVLAVVDDYNADPGVDAVLIQYPFPDGIDYETALLRLDPAKDADGLHPVNLGRLVMGVEAPVACTPAGIQALLVHYDIPIAGQHVVIVGPRPDHRSSAGQPADPQAAGGQRRGDRRAHRRDRPVGPTPARPTSWSPPPAPPGSSRPTWSKPGAVVVGAGVRYEGRKVLPDVVEEVAEVASWISPRIGGVGPMTRALLYRNTVEAAERAAG